MANLSPLNFKLVDTDDQLRIIKRILKELDFTDKEYDPKEIQSRINFWKEEGIRPTKVQLRDVVATKFHSKYFKNMK